MGHTQAFGLSRRRAQREPRTEFYFLAALFLTAALAWLLINADRCLITKE